MPELLQNESKSNEQADECKINNRTAGGKHLMSELLILKGQRSESQDSATRHIY